MLEMDFTADCAYVTVPGQKGQIAARTRSITSWCNVDLDSDGMPIGVEIIGLQSVIPLAELALYGLPPIVYEMLLAISGASLRIDSAPTGDQNQNSWRFIGRNTADVAPTEPEGQQ